MFLKFVYVFINAGIGWNFNSLNVLCQITFTSCTLSDMDQGLSVEYKTMFILMFFQDLSDPRYLLIIL